MAEPLLKRTFSRLRGKDRFRRKTDPKLTDIPGKTEVSQSSSSSSVSTSAVGEVVSQPTEDISSRNQITVAKKQNWAKLSSTFRDPISTEGSHSLACRSQDWAISAGKAQVPKQAWSLKTLTEVDQENKYKDSEWEPGFCSKSVNPGLTELTHPAGNYPEVCVSSTTVKQSGQGAYLQSLDRSSRAWVLSTGKTQALEDTPRLVPTCLTEGRQGVDGDKNIWYNPIPEEEDPRGAEGSRDYGNPWRKRELEEFSETTRNIQTRNQKRAGMLGSPNASGGASWVEQRTNQSSSEGSSLTSIHHSKDIISESSASSKKESQGLSDVLPPMLQSDGQVLGVSVGGSTSSSVGGSTVVSPSDSPGAQKKGSTSVMDKIKSPGTVRKLSMKMRKLPELRRKLSLRSSRNQRHGHAQSSRDGASPPNTRKESSDNVITRYHLDTSAPARPQRRSSRGRSASKGGYLSDGDSPELLPKQGSPTAQTMQEAGHEGGSYRLYCLSDQPRCAQRVSGLLTVHLMGLEELLRSPKVDGNKEVFCAIQVDGVTRARTSLLTCRGSSLSLNHTFNLELEKARLLKLVVLTPHAGPSGACPGPAASSRNRVCCLGAVSIPPLFKASRSQQLCVKLEPRGLLYVKLTLLEQWDPPSPSPRPSDLQPASVFGVELRRLVDKERSAVPVPLLIQKTVAEIEKRGVKGVGLYRLCGSAAVKKELRDSFERDSAAVTLSEELYPDINVITGVLKDYLRELPSPLITRTLYEVVLEAMSQRPLRAVLSRSDTDTQRSQNTVCLLDCLPDPEKATLSLLLDHLSLVASHSDSNRMTSQNLAVCFGPVLLTPSQEGWRPGIPGGNTGRGRSFAHSEEIASAVDFKRHIEALHYLLQLWPIPKDRETNVPPIQPCASPPSPVSQRPCQRLPLCLDLAQGGVVSRSGRGRLESPPCNRYAGDWSVCGRDFLSGIDADYDEVAGSDSDQEEEEEQVPLKKDDWASPGALYVDDFALDFDAPFTCRLSLKDFDTLISDLERELSKQINICL